MKLLIALVLALIPLSARAALDIYWIDVEGGASTLVVTDAGQSVLMDSGYTGLDNRDVDRVEHVVKQEAGLDHIDYYLTSHFHPDHVGGLAGLAERVEIRNFVDYGDSVARETAGGKAIWDAYLAAVGGKRRTVTPGETLALEGVEFVFVASNGETLKRPLPGAGAANPLCASYEPKPDDQGENGRSLGYVLKSGNFEFVNLGDLPWSFQHRLACPVNIVGEVDLYQAAHHATRDDVLPQQLWPMRPTVAVSNNGPAKGGGPRAMEYLKQSPGLEDLWQLHRVLANDAEHNAAEELTANLGASDGCEGHWIRARVEGGSYTVTNGRNGFSKTYAVK
jgi:L-ascorbate metabolism protein UlaG (beta-lactamase superfamily)